MKRLAFLTLTLSLLPGPLAWAQADGGADATQADPFEAMRAMASGEFSSGEHTLRIVGVESPPFEKPLYVELVRRGFETEPDRQQLWWFYERDGVVRVRVNQFPPRVLALFATNLADLAVGAWGAPQFYPQIRSDQYDAVGDLVATMEDGRLTLRSEHPFAVSFGGAISSEVEITFDAETASWLEVGRDADGAVAWPAPDNLAPIAMARQATMRKAQQLPSGVVVIDLREGLPLSAEGMDQIENGDSVAVHYTGWLATGVLVDSSKLPGRNAYIGPVPAQAAPPGFTDALLGMHGPNFAFPDRPFSGSVRRAFIPPSRAYGAQGNPPIIPANSSLIFNFEVDSIKPDIFEAPKDQKMEPTRPPQGG